MSMEEIREFLVRELEKAGIPKEFITSFDMTLDDLGLDSIEMVNVSAAAFNQYGVRLVVVKDDHKTLEDICKEIEANKK